MDETVLVLAPLGRDAEVLGHVLGQAGVPVKACGTLEAIVEGMRTGASIAILTEEALTERGVTSLVQALRDEPPWSETPILLLLSSSREPMRSGGQQLVSAVRVSILRRPISTLTLLTTTSTLRAARRRQHEVRRLIESERAERLRAEHATRVKDEFLATVSHELRTPLGAISLWSGLLERGQLGPDQTHEAVVAIRRSAEAQTRLIEDLLDLSRMMTGKLRLAINRHDISAIARAAIEVVTPMAQLKRVALVLELPPELETLVDPDRLQQIVWNLLVNAIKFTPAGGEVRIQTSRQPEHLVLSVSDTGVGIAAELMPVIFERFRQGDARAGHRHAGLGVGLPIVRDLVQLHGGVVEAHSEGTGRGATFVIRLPAP